jgi:hypothetical protein
MPPFHVHAWHPWLEERDSDVFYAETETDREAFRIALWLRQQGLRVRVTGPDLEPITEQRLVNVRLPPKSEHS